MNIQADMEKNNFINEHSDQEDLKFEKLKKGRKKT